jgi:hypothetical protein
LSFLSLLCVPKYVEKKVAYENGIDRSVAEAKIARSDKFRSRSNKFLRPPTKQTCQYISFSTLLRKFRVQVRVEACSNESILPMDTKEGEGERWRVLTLGPALFGDVVVDIF